MLVFWQATLEKVTLFIKHMSWTKNVSIWQSDSSKDSEKQKKTEKRFSHPNNVNNKHLTVDLKKTFSVLYTWLQ